MSRESILLEQARRWAPADAAERKCWLERHGLIAMLPELSAPNEARSWTLSNLADNALLLGRAKELAAQFKTEGIPAVFLKGIDLLQRVYSERQGVRRTSDIDVLVGAEDLPAAFRVLERLGYEPKGGEPLETQRRWSHHVTFQGANRVNVELHRLLSQDMGFFVGLEDLERADAIERGQGLAGSDRMRLEALLVHLLVHLAAHRFGESLRWVLDVLVILDRFGDSIDPVVLTEVAERLGGKQAAGAASLAIARLLPGVDLGPLAHLPSGSVRERMALALVDPVLLAQRGRVPRTFSFASRLLLGTTLSTSAFLLYCKTRLWLARHQR